MSSAGLERLPAAAKIDFGGKRMADATLLNLAGYVIPMIVGFATIPFLIRGLGVERFGILSLVWVLSGYFAVFDLGLGLAATKFVSAALGENKACDIPGIIRQGTMIQAGLGFIAAAVMAVVSPFLAEHAFQIPEAFVRDAKSAFIVIALTLPAGFVTGSLRGSLEASQRFGWVNAVKIPTNAGSYLIPLAGAHAGLTLTEIVALLLVLRTAAAAVFWRLLVKVYPSLRQRTAWNKNLFRKMLRFGGWVTLSDFAWPIFAYLDRMMIAALIGVQAVGYYTAPYEVVTRFGVITGSLWMTIFPAFSALEASRNLVLTQRIFDRSRKYVLLTVGTVMILAVAYGRFFMTAWLGEEYGRHCILVFQLLGIGFLAESLATIAFSFLQAIGRSDIPAKWHLLELILYLPAAWLLIKAYGIDGAAAAYLFRAVLNLVLMMSSAAKLRGLRIFAVPDRSLGRAAKALGLLTALVIAGQTLGFEDLASVAYTSPLAAAYAVVVWKAVLDRDEKSWLLTKAKLPWLKGKAAG
ncbi:MAG: flippase [Candidatus Aminicenantes bacterium]|nr:flippase [Candidatus Aminicenantes bacterium]